MPALAGRLGPHRSPGPAALLGLLADGLGAGSLMLERQLARVACSIRTVWFLCFFNAVKTQDAPAAFVALLIGCKEQISVQIAATLELRTCL